MATICSILTAPASIRFLLSLILFLAYLGLSTAQREGDVRLIGPTDYQGTVAVYHNGEWGTICDDSWNSRDADVICKQLGFEKSNRIWYNAYYGQGPGPIFVDQIDCPISAKTILDCKPTVENWGIHDCSKKEDAGVDCKRKIPVKPPDMPIKISCPEHVQNGSCNVCPQKQHPSPGDCYPRAIVEGIIFANYNNRWRPVSGEGWTIKEARIACQELGYPITLGIPTLQEVWTNWNGQYCDNRSQAGQNLCTPQEISENIEYRQTLANTLLGRVQCIGNERRLLDCYFSEFGPHNNTLMKVATVRCGFEAHSNCTQNSLTTEIYRLRGGPVPWVGRVEARVKGVWGTICDTEWDFAEANIICRALGYGSVKQVHYRSFYGRGVGPIHYTELRCNGSEKILGDCREKITDYRAGQCGHGRDAGLACSVPLMCPDSEKERARLYEVPQDLYPQYKESYVQIRGSYGWGLLCFNAFSIQVASVICRSIRHSFVGRIRSGFAKNYNGTLYNGYLQCDGDEESIDECKIALETASSCDGGTSNYAIVDCTKSLPDLVPDLATITNSIRYYPYIERSPMYYLQCALEEGCLSSSANGQPISAVRSLLRFDSLTMNWGTADFLPHQPRSEWQYHTCHNHYHSFEAFIHYDLLNATTGVKVAEGHKASFCLEDSLCIGGSRRFSCSHGNQGIAVNCGDLYSRHLDCQWIDVTDVPPGIYILRLLVNPDNLVLESDYKNNVVQCALEIYPGFFLRYIHCSLSDH